MLSRRSVLRVALAAAAGAAHLAGCAQAPGASDDRIASLRAAMLDVQDPRVIVIAHRGCWSDAPENSLAAIEACAALGVDMIEIDVRRTADGVLVLMHDETVDRTTDGAGRVDALAYAELDALRLRERAGGPDTPTTDEHVPTFEAAMRAARGRLLVNLDAKADVYDDAFTVLDSTGTTDHILMKRRISAGDGALALESPFDRVLSMPIVDQRVGPADALLAAQADAPPPAVEVIFTDLAYGEAAAAEAQAMGARAWINTLHPALAAGLLDADARADPDAVWGRAIDMGFTMIQTDDPRGLAAYIAARGD